jgi:hypothetical protein
MALFTSEVYRSTGIVGVDYADRWLQVRIVWMIRRIREHNHLNGVMFVLGEFLLVTAAALVIAAGFVRQGNGLGALLAAGTAVNCLVVVGFALIGYRSGERGASVASLLSNSYRAEVARNHPTLMADTIAITVAALVPYCLALLVVRDATRRGV